MHVHKKFLGILKSCGWGILFFLKTLLAIILMILALPFAWVGWSILDSNLGHYKIPNAIAILLIMPMTLVVIMATWKSD